MSSETKNTLNTRATTTDPRAHPFGYTTSAAEANLFGCWLGGSLLMSAAIPLFQAPEEGITLGTSEGTFPTVEPLR